MRIVQIGPYPLSPELIKGGVESSVFGLAQEQSKTMEVFAFDTPREEELKDGLDGAVMVYRFKRQGERQVSAMRSVREVVNKISELNPDICHIHSTSLFAWRIYRSLKRKGINCIVTIHGLATEEKRKQLKKRRTLKFLLQFVYQSIVELIFISQIKHVIVDTEYVSRQIQRYPILHKPNIHIIPQGISHEYGHIKCDGRSNVFLSVGAISERKGHALTIRAFEGVRQKGVQASLLIAGNVADGRYYNHLLQLVDNSPYKNDIQILTNVSQGKLIELYQSAHIFVLHSEEESQGIVLAEAMATGMPIVATNVGGIPNVVTNGETGLLSGYGDIAAFSKNMVQLITDLELWQVLSYKAVNQSKQYLWKNISDKISDLYAMVK